MQADPDPEHVRNRDSRPDRVASAFRGSGDNHVALQQKIPVYISTSLRVNDKSDANSDLALSPKNVAAGVPLCRCGGGRRQFDLPYTMEAM